EGALKQLFTLLRKTTGVDFSHYKETTVKRRISRRMVLHRLEELPDYLRFVQDNPAELGALSNDMLIPVTNFFRDQETFESLKRQVFPRIMQDRPEDSPIRIWSVGCSTGEEAYSLVIALLEFLGDNAPRTAIKMFATDVSEVVIAQARAGVYLESISADVSP